ncbi:MAG: hypothetical protein MJY93_02460 [Fibrobacter sp.]|nr:hypothetical protein [Fibrobacter sp.]
MKKSLVKLLMALSMVLTFAGCEITVVEDDPVPEVPVLKYNYKWTSYCEGTSDDACEDLKSSSYVRIIGELIKGQIVTIEAYLPGDPHPDFSEDYYYDGRKEDALGTYYDFYSVSENPATSFAVYDGDYASFYMEDESWMYNFTNDPDLYKKAAK